MGDYRSFLLAHATVVATLHGESTVSGCGTFRTCHDFPVESAFGSKAEVRALSLPRAASGAKRLFTRLVSLIV
jgi:hypothetical protein